ncbi:permease-like cell division protein FtsX [Thalassotalea atypica]|uniref:permease-like cell division protein FtsX n=1 Tax=Thalassotalea atypica TaxID=2054316 RepID=UPI002573260D|nr:permease-like cell division protein FtsX [Thalassotalea atypica]
MIFKFNQDGNSQSKVSLSQKAVSWPIRHLQQAIGSLGDMWRTPFTSMMTILVLGISLTLPATLHLFVKNADNIVSRWDSSSEISLYLKLSVTEQQAQKLVRKINLFPEVEKVDYISSEQALENFKESSGLGKALEYLKDNPLPATLMVTPTQRASQASAAKELLAKLEQEREVDQGKLDLEWLNRLQAMAVLIEDIVIAVALMLCSSVVLIVGNTIRLAILHQKEAIAVMKMVGATDAFIQRPFMYTGAWYGIAGGFFASILIAVLASYLSGALVELTDLYHSSYQLERLSFSENMMLIGLAIALGLIGSYVSVRQHIRAIEPSSD